MKPVVLIVSTGRQDLKFWSTAYSEEDQQLYVATLRIGNCRAFHEHLKNQPDIYEIKTPEEIDELLKEKAAKFSVDARPSLLLKQIDAFLDWDNERTVVKNRNIYRDKIGLDTANESQLEFRPLKDNAGRYILAPAKLANTICWLKHNKHSIKIMGALFFATHREETINEEHKKNEPIAAGHVLAKWLAESFDNLRYSGSEGDHFNDYNACWINYLKGLPDYSGTGLDAPVHRQAVRFIDDAVNSFAEHYPDSIALLSDTGGMAEVKACLNASARFRFRNRVAEIPESETRIELPDLAQLQQESRLPSRRESLETRMHCEQRIWQGDFLGAWGAVAHLRDSRDDAEWVEAVQQLSDFIRGAEVSLQHHFYELRDIVSHPYKDVLRAAFRVEAALQVVKEDDLRITDAVLGTVNFYDIALRALVNQTIKEDDEFCFVEFDGEEMDGKVKLIGQIPPEYCLDKKFFTVKKKDKKTTYFISLGLGGDQDWLVWLAERRQKNTLKEFAQRLDQTLPQKNKSIRTYRNFVAHRALSHLQAEDAIKIAKYGTKKNKHLWNLENKETYNSDQLGNYFLSVPITTDVFTLFGIDNAAALYQNMMTGLINRIRSPIKYDKS